MNRKEEIIMATLELAAEKGLGSVSMNMIADKVGIKKPSLYNHFVSKEEIVQAMYEYLREQAKGKSQIKMMVTAQYLPEKQRWRFYDRWSEVMSE